MVNTLQTNLSQTLLRRTTFRKKNRQKKGKSFEILIQVTDQRYLRYKTAPNRGSNYHISTAKVMTKQIECQYF